ncbi:hypothetical protein D3C73_1536150 [compost metagenome]
MLDQPAGHLVHPFYLGFIRVDRRCGDFDNILKIGKQLLLDGILQRLVRSIFELPPPAGIRGNLDQNLLAECPLLILGNADLLLDGAHQLLVGIMLL